MQQVLPQLWQTGNDRANACVMAVLVGLVATLLPVQLQAGFEAPAAVHVIPILQPSPEAMVPSPRKNSTALEQRTRVIITHSERRDGSTQENRGSGVVVGNYFLTVHHNLRPGPTGRFVRNQSYLGGVPVKPVFADPVADLAIIPIPPQLCENWCEHENSLPDIKTKMNQTVHWYRDPASSSRVDPGWRKAQVMSRTWTLPTQRTVGSLGADCDSGLVLEVDQPFLPGSSGTGIWNSQNQLLGVAQGSYQTRDGNKTGYFKPLRCIRGHWPTPLSRPDALAVLDRTGKRLTRPPQRKFRLLTGAD